MAYSKLIRKLVPQSEPLNNRQVVNDAGGYLFALDNWSRLDRFLILGAAEGTYHVAPRTHAARNLEALRACLAESGERAVGRIVEVSVQGLAAKQDHAIFALAAAVTLGDPATKAYALDYVRDVCRTGSTFFLFLEELKSLRTLTGRSIKRAVGGWYDREDQNWLAYQLVKYRSRNGWTHRDALRVGHPKNGSSLLQWAVSGSFAEGATIPAIVEGFLRAQAAPDAVLCAKVVSQYELPREGVPTEYLNSPEVWDALLEQMPLTAMLRNLGNMSKVGLLVPNSEAADRVTKQLADGERLRKSRVHPMSVLIARKVYELGHGVKGSGSWEPVPSVVAALDEAFYAAYGNVTPTGKRMLVGLDVSGSMSYGWGSPAGLIPSDIAAALAMVWVATEPKVEVMGFADTFRSLAFHRRMSLGEALAKTRGLTFGRTDCALPMLWASRAKRDFDAFVIVTDNETWAGEVHPVVALRDYRKTRVANARQVVLATTAIQGSVADPNDALSLDISGFSADVPLAISVFLSAGQGESSG